MPVKTKIEDRKFIESVKLPEFGGRYSCIPHGKVADIIYENLDKNGFSVEREYFNSTANGQIVTSHFVLNLNLDNELKFEIATLNSYNKQKRFVAVGGSHVIVCENSHILGDSSYGSIKRKHIGEAYTEVVDFIPEMIKRAYDNFQELIKQKERMKEIELNKKTIASLIGDLYINEGLIADAQMSIIKGEIENPSFNYSSIEGSLWTTYNAVTFGLKSSHASKVIENHQKLNDYVVREFQLV